MATWNLLTVDDPAAARTAIDAAGKAEAFPTYTVSTYYGGTLGEGDDTVCIQATLDAAYEAGGGVVVLPPLAVASAAAADSTGPYYYYSQLVIPKWVHFTGGNWSTLGVAGTVARMRQLTGVNDDSIIFNAHGDATARPFVGPMGISNLVLRAASGTTGGHAINFRQASGGMVGVMDASTFDRIYARGFYGSTIKLNKTSPANFTNIGGLFNGGYVVEIEDTGIDGEVSSIHQVLMRNITGDGNMGYAADAGGATVYAKGLNPVSSLVLNGIKGEYRIRSSNSNGDDVSMGNRYCIVLENCSNSVSVVGASHIATGGSGQTRKPGDVIVLIGPNMPDLSWQSVTVRTTVSTQVDGSDPNLILDQVNNRGINAHQGVLSHSQQSSGTQRSMQIEHTANQSGTAGYRVLDINSTSTATGSGAHRLLNLSVDGSTAFSVDDTGQATALGGYDFGSGDTVLTRASAGRVQVGSTTIADFVDAPTELTSGSATIRRRDVINSTGLGLGSGSMRLSYFTPRTSATIASIRTIVGTTATATPTLNRIGLYTVDGSGNLTLVASTTHDASLWSATSTRYTKALSSSYAITRGTRYAVGVLSVGSTAPSLLGYAATHSDELAEAPRLSASLSGQTDLPASVTVGSLSNTTQNVYAVMVP